MAETMPAGSSPKHASTTLLKPRSSPPKLKLMRSYGGSAAGHSNWVGPLRLEELPGEGPRAGLKVRAPCCQGHFLVLAGRQGITGLDPPGPQTRGARESARARSNLVDEPLSRGVRIAGCQPTDSAGWRRKCGSGWGCGGYRPGNARKESYGAADRENSSEASSRSQGPPSALIRVSKPCTASLSTATVPDATRDPDLHPASTSPSAVTKSAVKSAASGSGS